MTRLQINLIPKQFPEGIYFLVVNIILSNMYMNLFFDVFLPPSEREEQWKISRMKGNQSKSSTV
jgi:hypothetical protein